MDGSRTSISGAASSTPSATSSSVASLTMSTVLLLFTCRNCAEGTRAQSCSRMPGDFLVGSVEVQLAEWVQVRVDIRAVTNDWQRCVPVALDRSLCKASRSVCVRYTPDSTKQYRLCSERQSLRGTNLHVDFRAMSFLHTQEYMLRNCVACRG